AHPRVGVRRMSRGVTCGTAAQSSRHWHMHCNIRGAEELVASGRRMLLGLIAIALIPNTSARMENGVSDELETAFRRCRDWLHGPGVCARGSCFGSKGGALHRRVARIGRSTGAHRT